jgi:hypothetical protein
MPPLRQTLREVSIACRIGRESEMLGPLVCNPNSEIISMGAVGETIQYGTDHAVVLVPGAAFVGYADRVPLQQEPSHLARERSDRVWPPRTHIVRPGHPASISIPRDALLCRD